jgi:hypothetical protein
MPPQPRAAKLSTVVATGDQRASLEAIRDKLARLLEGADRKTAPALATRLQSVLAELYALPGGREVTKLDRIAAGVSDDLAARRDRRAPGKPDAACS